MFRSGGIRRTVPILHRDTAFNSDGLFFIRLVPMFSKGSSVSIIYYFLFSPPHKHEHLQQINSVTLILLLVVRWYQLNIEWNNRKYPTESIEYILFRVKVWSKNLCELKICPRLFFTIYIQYNIQKTNNTKPSKAIINYYVLVEVR